MLALFGSAGCDDAGYDPPSLVNKLRILAARSDPPYIGLDGASAMQLLVAGAPEPDALCYAWAYCPFAWPRDGNFACIDDRLQVDLGTQPTATVGLGEVLTALQHIGEVFKDLGLKQPGGLGGQTARTCSDDAKVSIPQSYILFQVAEARVFGGTCPADSGAMLKQPCADRSRCLAGFKRLGLGLKLDCASSLPKLNPNEIHNNPTLQGLTLGGVSWPGDVTPTLAAGSSVQLVPQWPPGDLEFISHSPDPKAADRIESLLFSWFSTGGRFSRQRSYDASPVTEFQVPAIPGTSLTPVTLWVVVHDGRNGTDWLRRDVLVGHAAATGNPLCAVRSDLAGCP